MYSKWGEHFLSAVQKKYNIAITVLLKNDNVSLQLYGALSHETINW